MRAGTIIPSDEVYKRIKRGYLAFCIQAVIMIIFGLALIIVFNVNEYLGNLIPLILMIGANSIGVGTQTRDLLKAM